MARTQRRRTAAATATSEPAPETPRRVRDNLPRPVAGSPGAGISRPEPRRKRSPFSFLRRFEPRFIADIVAELRKVTWPSFAETRYLTVVVAIVAVIMGAFLGLLDLGFGWVIERIFF